MCIPLYTHMHALVLKSLLKWWIMDLSNFFFFFNLLLFYQLKKVLDIER